MKFSPSLIRIFVFLGIARSALAFRPISVEPDTELALSGFDVVSYHVSEAPVKGHPSFQIKWSGAYWRFSSQTNMRKFKNDPQKFAPEFGGYCAVGMAAGGKEVHACNPTVYTIQDGRLIVFSSKAQLESWQENPEESLRVGTETYNALLSESTKAEKAESSKG
ncbi:MAG: YHS domain-containing (seleno)protein [Opitutales bacterium]